MKYLFVIVILLVLSVPAFAQSNPVHDALVDRPAYYVTTGCNEVAGTMLPEIALMFQRLVAFMMPDAAQMHVMEIGIPSANNGLSAVPYSTYVISAVPVLRWHAASDR